MVDMRATAEGLSQSHNGAQSLFRDVTNLSRMANKENIPPGATDTPASSNANGGACCSATDVAADLPCRRRPCTSTPTPRRTSCTDDRREAEAALLRETPTTALTPGYRTPGHKPHTARSPNVAGGGASGGGAGFGQLSGGLYSVYGGADEECGNAVGATTPQQAQSTQPLFYGGRAVAELFRSPATPHSGCRATTATATTLTAAPLADLSILSDEMPLNFVGASMLNALDTPLKEQRSGADLHLAVEEILRGCGMTGQAVADTDAMCAADREKPHGDSEAERRAGYFAAHTLHTPISACAEDYLWFAFPQPQAQPRQTCGATSPSPVGATPTRSDDERDVVRDRNFLPQRVPRQLPIHARRSLDLSQPPCSTAMHYFDGKSGAAAMGSHAAPARRSHYMSNVKAAAGSLIAVGGRRVPVDKLHLLRADGPAEKSASVLVPSVRPTPDATTTTHTITTTMHATAGGGVVAQAAAHGGRRGAGRCSVEDATVGVTTEELPRMLTLHEPSARPVPVGRRLLQSTVAASEHARVVPSTTTAAATARTARTLLSSGKTALCSSCAEENLTVVLQFARGSLMRFKCNVPGVDAGLLADGVVLPAAPLHLQPDAASDTAALITVHVGQSYLAHVYSHRSPYDHAAFADVGVCVEIAHCDDVHGQNDGHARSIVYDGVILRAANVVCNALDATQHEYVLQKQAIAFAACERHVQFLQLPIQVETVRFTFDMRVCVVYYNKLVTDDASHDYERERLRDAMRDELQCEVYLTCL